MIKKRADKCSINIRYDSIKSNLMAPTFLIRLPSRVVMGNPPYPFDMETISHASILKQEIVQFSKPLLVSLQKMALAFFRNIIFISILGLYYEQLHIYCDSFWFASEILFVRLIECLSLF